MSLTCATVRLNREEEEEAEVAQLGEIIMLIARMSVHVRLTGGRMSRISDEEVEVADKENPLTLVKRSSPPEVKFDAVSFRYLPDKPVWRTLKEENIFQCV